jgi:hypothetical protein
MPCEKRSGRCSPIRGTGPGSTTWRSQLFDAIFQHAEGYDGLPDTAAVKGLVLGAQATAAAYARNYPGTVKEIRKALRVNKAFQQVLDDPEAATALQQPALKPLLDEAADST